MGHEQDLWRENKMTPIEKHYLGLSELYLAELEDTTQSLYKIMQVKGILVHIESDIIAYLKKNKPNKKSDKQQEWLKVFTEAIDHFDKILMSNQQMKLSIRRNIREQHDLLKKIEELKADNELLENLINEADDG